MINVISERHKMFDRKNFTIKLVNGNSLYFSSGEVDCVENGMSKSIVDKEGFTYVNQHEYYEKVLQSFENFRNKITEKWNEDKSPIEEINF